MNQIYLVLVGGLGIFKELMKLVINKLQKMLKVLLEFKIIIFLEQFIY